jgi:hypothetical protein
MKDTGSPGCNEANFGTDCGYNVQTKSGSTVYGELAHMYFVTLGNKSFLAPNGDFQADHSLQNVGPFKNLDNGGWWYGTPSVVDPTFEAWSFSGIEGYQGLAYQSSNGQAWAVHNGDVGTPTSVPEPATMLMGLAGLSVAVALLRKTTARV